MNFSQLHYEDRKPLTIPALNVYNGYVENRSQNYVKNVVTEGILTIARKKSGKRKY